MGCGGVSHLEDFEVVLRFFYKLSDCKVHSLFVAGKKKYMKQHVSCLKEFPDLQCGGSRVSSQEFILLEATGNFSFQPKP